MTEPSQSSRIAFLTQLLEELPLGVIVLDGHGKVRHFNQYEERMARRQRRRVLGKPFFDQVAPCMDVRELRDPFFDRIGRRPLSVDLEFAFPFPFMETPRDVIVRLRSFQADGDHYGVLFIEDVSARKAVERMKETLSSLLVHDLKNPMSTALAAVGYLRGDPAVAGSADLIESANDARRALHRLDRMVLDLLDVTRLETGNLPLDRARVDVAELAREVVADARRAGELAQVGLHVEAPGEPVVADVDQEVTRRALDNLIHNGLRHARSRVVTRVGEGEGMVVLEVEDDGPGVADELKERIFDKYTRVALAQERGGEGRARNRGLGLTFVQLAARAHGGQVSVHDAKPSGAMFRLALPRAPSPAEPPQGP